MRTDTNGKRRTAALITTAAFASAALISPAASAGGLPAVNWHECPEAAGTDPDTQCSEIEVPMDYSDPAGESISVMMSRIPAESGTSQGVIAGNPGGPGGSALGMFSENLVRMPESIRQNYDLIGVQPRGHMWATPLECPIIDEASLFEACEKHQPGYAATITTENTPRDLEEARKALGVEKIGLYGVSYGSDLMSTYVTLFGDRVDGLVLDSGVNPADRYFEFGISREPWRREALEAMLQWISERDNEFGLGDTPLKVYTRWADLINDDIGLPGQAYPPPAQVGDLPVALQENPEALLQVTNSILPAAWRGQAFFGATTGGAGQKSALTDITLQSLYFESLWPEFAELLVSGEIPQATPPEELPQDVLAMATGTELVQLAITCNDNITEADSSLAPQMVVDSLTGGDLFSLNDRQIKSGLLCSGWPAQQAAVDHSPADLDRQPLILHYTNDSAVTGPPAAESVRDTMDGNLILREGYSHGLLLALNDYDDPEIQDAVVRQYTGSPVSTS